MMVVMKETASDAEIEAVVERIERVGAKAHVSKGARVTVVGAIGDVETDAAVGALGLEGLPGVDRVVPILKPFKLASLQFRHGEPSSFEIGGARIGGPCTVESREQVLATAEAVKEGGAAMLRGGAYKPRTSPYSFQGLGVEG